MERRIWRPRISTGRPSVAAKENEESYRSMPTRTDPDSFLFSGVLSESILRSVPGYSGREALRRFLR